MSQENLKTEENKSIAQGLSIEELTAELKKRSEEKSNQRKAYKELVSDQVPSMIESLKFASEALADVKTKIFIELQQLMAIKQELYNIKDTQRSHSFTTKTGDSVEIGYRVADGWDDTVTSGEAKVAEFMSSLATDEKSKMLVKSLNRLLKRDANNNLNAGRVMELKSLAEDYNSELFNDGVSIIMEAYRPKHSVFYIKGSYKDKNSRERFIPLSISAVEFTDAVDLSIFKTEVDADTKD